MTYNGWEAYEAHWKLRLKKQVVVLAFLCFSIASNWGENFQMLRFLWTCLFTDQHSVPLDKSYWDTEFVTFRAGVIMATFSAWMVTAYIVCLMLDIFRVRVDLTESELLEQRTRLERRHKDLASDLKRLKTSEELIGETFVTRKALASLHEDLVRIRLELSAVKAVKSRAKKSPTSVNANDLFDDTRALVVPSKKARRRSIRRPPRQSAPPKF